MAKKPFISVDGITVGEASALVNVIASNGDITTSNITVSNNANLGNVGNIIITGGTNGYVLSTNGSGNLSWVAQSGGGSSNISNGNSNVNIATANGNITMSAVGNANIVVVTGTGANINGYANISGNVIAGNFIAGSGSGGNLSGANVVSANTFTATGNITAGNANLGNSVTANYFIGNFYGTANSATSANTAGTVTTAAQPNITSVGTLSGLTSTGTVNLTGASNVALGPVANVHITGGTNGQYLSTDGSGTLSWSTISVSSASISNGNSNVNIPSSNGNVNISAVGNANVLIVTGTGVNVAGTGNFTGNLTAGNFIAGSGSGGNVSGANNISANTFTGTLTTAAQPNITSVGTLTSLAVTGNITSGNANLGNSVTANFFIGSGANLTSIPAGNISGQVANALVAGTVYTNAQPNITSVGTLTTVSVSGNANTGNLGTTNFIATGSGSFGANVNMNTYWINNVGYPNLSTDVASKAYVDTMVSSGISYHQPVAVATTTTLATATSGTTAYNSPNGAANGIGAYISTTGTFNLIDTANVQTVGTRILVKDEANAAWNGIYTYANTTAIVRSSDADEYGSDSTEQLSINDYFFTTDGSVNKGVAFIVSAPSGTITFGTSNITFAQFSSSQVYSAGTGLTLTGTTFSVNASQTQITSVGTLTGLAVNGNITAANITANTGVFTGNGNGLSSLVGANVTGQVTYAGTANAVAGANVTGQVGNALIAGTVYTNAQPNITSVGTLTSVTVSGTSNLGPVGNLTITGGTSGYYLQTNGSGTLTWASIPTGTGISNGNSNVNIPSANGNINLTAVGNTTLVITGTGANVTGTLNVSGNANVGNIGATNGVFTNVSGNGSSLSSITGANVTGTVPNATAAGTAGTAGYATNALNATYAGSATTANIVIDNAQPNITSVGTLTSLDVTGNISGGNANLGNLVTANYFTGNGSLLTGISATVAQTVSNAAQPNITSVGTLTSLAVSGTTNLGAVGNVTITGGSANGYLRTDGSGSLSWNALPTTTVTVDSFNGDGTTTAFTLSVTPTSKAYTTVTVGGVTQYQSSYTVSGTTLTFSSPPPNGTVIEVQTIASGGSATPITINTIGGSAYVGVSANTTMVAGNVYIVNTSSANLTMILPATGTLGDSLGVIDGTGNSNVHAITINRNGGNIMGSATDMVITTPRAAFNMVYYNSTQGWLLTQI